MTDRDRSQGWVYAKRSGHAFEDLFGASISDEDSVVGRAWRDFRAASYEPWRISEVAPAYGRGRVPSILARPTTPKGDVRIELEDGIHVLISIKKPDSVGGQAHLTTLKNFASAMNHFLPPGIPQEALWCLRAFCGETDGEVIRRFAPAARLSTKVLHGQLAEEYQNRLYASTIRESYPELWTVLLGWVEANISPLTRFVFSQGHAANRSDWADLLYIGSASRFVSIQTLCDATERYAQASGAIAIGTTGRFPGSTIQLPWGFLQAHRPGKDSGPYQLQFHHEDSKVELLIRELEKGGAPSLPRR